jgi:hypothetical protein
MTTQERIGALRRFGYERDEARFLGIAALHSGYFLRRQFLAFIGGTKGWKDVTLITKLKANRHCRVNVYRHNRMIYHLSAKPLYDALGEKDNRNRRERQPSTIKNKLMGLDFVLEHPNRQYLATEREKLDYFVGTLKIAEAELPTRWYESPRGRGAAGKHFVDKYPMFLSVPRDGTAPVVHFCYVDEGALTPDGFGTYLDQYDRLLAALPDFRVIYIAEPSGLFDGAGRVFEKFSGAGARPGKGINPATRQLLDYFEARREYEARDFSRFDTARLIRFREQKRQFAGQPYESLFGHWQAGGKAAVLGVLEPNSDPNQAPSERFSTYVLNHDYRLFGTLASGLHERGNDSGVQTQT